MDWICFNSRNNIYQITESQISSKTKLHAAIHESGHALIYFLLSIPIDHVTNLPFVKVYGYYLSKHTKDESNLEKKKILIR